MAAPRPCWALPQELRDERILSLLRDLVRINTEHAAPAPGAPYGEGCELALRRALLECESRGMRTSRLGRKVGIAEVGESGPLVAFPVHLDVVPAGDGWTHDPYGAEIIDGRIIGRGTSDDKGPGVAALFAMKAVLDAGIPLRRRCRLILGCDEECGMQDLEYYEQKVGLPAKGFSPDANFPLINTEKGIMAMTLHAPVADARLLSIACGTRSNVVPGTATAILAGDWREAAAEAFDVEDEDCALECEMTADGATRIVVTGVPAHASTPDKGKNAGKMLLRVLRKLGIGGAPVALLDEAAGDENEGRALGIAGSDEVSGRLTINLGLLSAKDGTLDVTFDCRYPVFFDDRTISATVHKRLAPAGFVMEPTHASAPHHVPESSELVQ